MNNNFMKKIILTIIIGTFMVCLANAQTRKSEQTKAWKKFQTVIARNDKQAVAAFIKFPFEASIIGSELDYKVESKAAFIKNYASIFTKTRRAKIVRAKYTPIDGEDEFNFEMDEDGAFQVFRFRKIGGAYYLVGTIAVG